MSWHFLDSDTQYVELADDAALTLPDGDWTIAGWFKLDDNVGTGWNGLFGWGVPGGTPSCNFYVREASNPTFPNQLSIAIEDGAGFFRGFETTATPGTVTIWQHLVVTRDGSTIKVYINGVVDVRTQPVSSFTAVDRGDAAIFGAFGNLGANSYLKGSMAHWAKWDSALSETQIQELAVYKTPGEVGAPVWWVKMDAADYSEEIVPIAVTNQGSTAGATEPIGTVHDWEGDVNVLHNVAGNWDLNAVPGTGDIALFDATSQGNCVVVVPWALQNLWMDSTFPDDIDLDTANLTMDDGGDVILAGAGTFDMGSGTLSIENGVFDYSGLTTLDDGTSTVVFSGTSTWIGSTQRIRNVEVAASADVTCTQSVTIDGDLTVDGNLILSSGVAFNPHILPEVRLGDGSSITGGTELHFSFMTTGKGIVAFHSNATISTPIRINAPSSAAVFVASLNYPATKLVGGASTTLNLSSGEYAFTSLELLTASGDLITLDTSASTTITVTGTLAIILQSDGDLDITSTGSEWHLEGDVTFSGGGSGDFTWTPGSEPLTLDGNADQAIDSGGVTLPALVIDKPLGAVQLASDFTTASFTGIEVDGFGPDSFTITVNGNCDFQSAFNPDDGFADWGGCVWDIGGNLTMDGNNIAASSEWQLNVTGTAIASGSGSIENCNASGGSPLIALGWTDGGGNTNVIFVAVGIARLIFLTGAI
jgi:phage baseplate assembly protein gpV